MLIGKLVWLYLLILLGWVAGTVVRVHREPIANLLLYILSPIVVFEGASTVSLTAANLSLPFFFLCLCSILCGIFFLAAKPLWRDGTRNLAAFASADGNTGYFGIPVALVLLGRESLGLIVLGSLGFLLYESTVGFFVLARGNFSVAESLRKLLRLPLLYAFVAGLLFQWFHLSLPGGASGILESARGAYSVLGMMVIGLGLTGLTLTAVDMRLLLFTGVAKFFIWPLVLLGFLQVDTVFLHVFSPEAHRVMLLLSAVPLAVNTVILSTVLQVQPRKAAVAVLVSTLLALLVIPLIALWFFP